MVLTLLDVFTFKKCPRLQHAILSQTVIIFKSQFPVSKNRPHANTDQHMYLQTVLGKMLPKCNVLNSIGDIRRGPHIIRQNGRCFSSGIDLWRCLITDSPRRCLIGTSHAVITGQRSSKSWFYLNSLSFIFSEQIMIVTFRKLGARCSHV